MMIRNAVRAVLLTSCVGGLWSCANKPSDPYTDDTPTSGHVLILADEDLRSLVEQEEMVFESIYENAQLDIRYLPEARLLKAMQNDSVRCVISTVLPGADEQAYYDKRKIKVQPVPICTDGIAVVVNKGRTCSSLSMDQLRAILDKKNQGLHWNAFEPSGDAPAADVVPLFTSAGSGIGRVLIDSLGLSGLRGGAGASVQEVVDHVAASADDLGLLPFAAISDLDDPEVRRLRDKVKLLPVSRSDTSKAVLPSQSTLADGGYPLRRTVYMTLVEGKSGLGTGFVSFVANHKGQRILLKLGVAPKNVPAREVEIVH